ncbi:MAG TPA: UDP-glucose/GDP-mannose dehydrogenase family protein [Rubrobacter sp.]|nr:UDP-glucose/GDP-mannose dehydrogenase family protein [Rubrobacter sp.]
MPVDSFEVGVIGAGYVGLATGACLAHLGHRVTCLDNHEERVTSLNDGQVPFYEPGLEDLVTRTAGAGRLSFAGIERLARVVRRADVVFIAVGTPQGDDGSADLSNVASVAREMGRALAGSPRRERPLVVVNKSTVPVGSGDHVSGWIGEGAGSAADFLVVSNPEFLREGSAVYDTLFPDRIVVGADSREPLETMRTLYEPIIAQTFPTQMDPRPKAAVPFVTTDLASAEMIKYASNAFLATKISFINEISNLCELTGADVGRVVSGIGLDGRIGSRFLNPGIGWGGSCFPKDVAALRAAAREYGNETLLLDATVAVNERQRGRVIQKLEHYLHTLSDKRIALLGLSFKPNTDDLRGAPSLEIASALNSLGAKAVGYDPVAGKAAAKLLPVLRVVFDPYEAIKGAHAAVVVTEWEEMRGLDPKKAASLMREPKLVVDGRNALDPAPWREAGLLYSGFGRG